LDFFANRDRDQLQRQLAEERRQAELEERRTQQRQAELAAEDRRRFERRWLLYALASRPPDDCPDYALLVKTEVLSALADIETDEDDSTVQQLVDGAIARALAPSREAEERRRARHRAVEHALDTLPVYARWDDHWESQARALASKAVDDAGQDATTKDLTALASVAVEPIVQQYRHYDRIQSAVKSVFVPGGNLDDLEEVREAMTTALSALPVGASDRQFEQVKAAALGPVQQRIASRRMMTRMEARLPQEFSGPEKETTLARVTNAIAKLPSDASDEQREKAAQRVIYRQTAKQQLIGEGLAEVPRHARRLLRRYRYPADETPAGIEQRVRSQVEQELRNELHGTETMKEVLDLTREIMEAAEGCR
jgi:hypothetical protein